MSFILDFIVVVFIIFCIVTGLNKSVKKNIYYLIAAIVAMGLSLLLSIPLSNPVEKYIIKPTYAASAANSMADLVSAEKKATGYETIHEVDVATLIQDNPNSFKRIQDKYRVYKDTLLAVEYGGDGTQWQYAEEVLTVLITPASRDVANALTLFVLFVLIYTGSAMIVRGFDEYDRKIKRIPVVILSVLRSFVFIFIAAACLSMVLPYLSGSYYAIFNENMIDKSVLFKIFANLFNVITGLF